MTYSERIAKIASACELCAIPYELRAIWDGLQITFPWCAGDIACHSGTYGVNNDKVESYQFPWDEGDVTELTVTEAIKKVILYYLTIG